MKHTIRLLLCSFGLASILVTSCSARQSTTAITQGNLIKMPSFQATLQRVEDGNVLKGGNLIDGNWVAAYFSITDGSRVCIGGPSASAEMVAFIRSLKKGQTYTLPDAFIAFQKVKAEQGLSSPASKHEPNSGVVSDSEAAKDIAEVVLSHLLTTEKREHLHYLDAKLKAGVWTVRYGYPALAITFPIVIQIRQQGGAVIKYENPNA